LPSEGARIAIASLYPSGSRNQPPRRTISNEINHPKYFDENDDIVFTSLRKGAEFIHYFNLLTLYLMFQVKMRINAKYGFRKREIGRL